MKVIKESRTFTERVAREIMNLAKKARTNNQWTGIDYIDVKEFSGYIEISFRTQEGSMSKWGTIRLSKEIEFKK